MTKVFAAVTVNGSIKYYKARIFTPICEKTECYDVEVNFYWDAIGNFVKYEVLPGKPLTKRKHDPFTDEDHKKLNRILLNPNPSFLAYEKEDLITDLVPDGLNGMTGATIKAIEHEIVSGAAYSCYTLWHIAHGIVKDSIQAFTSDHLDPELINYLASIDDEAAHFFLIDAFETTDYLAYHDLIEKMIRKKMGYFARYVIEKMPDEILQAQETQRLFIDIVPGLGYFGQLSLVNKIQGIMIQKELSIALIDLLEERDSQLKKEIISLVAGQDLQNESAIEVNQYLIQSIIEDDILLTDDDYQRIARLTAPGKDLRRLKRWFKTKTK